MRVKLATQVLSHTVSAAMLMAVSGGLLLQSATGTAEPLYCQNLMKFSPVLIVFDLKPRYTTGQ